MSRGYFNRMNEMNLWTKWRVCERDERRKIWWVQYGRWLAVGDVSEASLGPSVGSRDRDDGRWMLRFIERKIGWEGGVDTSSVARICRYEGFGSYFLTTFGAINTEFTTLFHHTTTAESCQTGTETTLSTAGALWGRLLLILHLLRRRALLIITLWWWRTSISIWRILRLTAILGLIVVIVTLVRHGVDLWWGEKNLGLVFVWCIVLYCTVLYCMDLKVMLERVMRQCTWMWDWCDWWNQIIRIVLCSWGSGRREFKV